MWREAFVSSHDKLVGVVSYSSEMLGFSLIITFFYVFLCRYYIPFFLENMGPIFSEWSVNAHEARPGHHTQASLLNLNYLRVLSR